MDNTIKQIIRLALPKGRMEEGVVSLLRDAGIKIWGGSRAYRLSISLPEFEVKVLKPQNIIEMLQAGSRDLGFAGYDWTQELKADVVELLDTGLDPVSLVAAAPKSLLENGALPKRHLVVASEYEQITNSWIKEMELDASFVKSFGATEVFPPEDADCIVDNTATGSTLKANDLEIISTLLKSSTRLYANPRALEDLAKREIIENFVLLTRSVLQARERVMLEVNVSKDSLAEIVAILPGMREPTISPLAGDSGFAVKAAVQKKEVPALIPKLKAKGGSDIVITSLSQIVP